MKREKHFAQVASRLGREKGLKTPKNRFVSY
jgi:hypothetical protein